MRATLQCSDATVAGMARSYSLRSGEGIRTERQTGVACLDADGAPKGVTSEARNQPRRQTPTRSAAFILPPVNSDQKSVIVPYW
jgi:hypothetical protein